MQLDAEESDFTEAFDFESMNVMENLDVVFTSIGGDAGSSAGQVRAKGTPPLCPARPTHYSLWERHFPYKLMDFSTELSNDTDIVTVTSFMTISYRLHCCFALAHEYAI